MDPNQNQTPQPTNSEPQSAPQADPQATPPPAVTAVEAPGLSPAKKSRKLLLAGILAPLFIIGSASAYYFGYYTNPSVILSQSLGNTGKGYAKLVNYLNQQNKLNYKGMTGSGSYSFKSGGTSTDGNLSFKSDGTNSDTTFDIGLGVTRVSAEIMTIKSASAANPDVYIKASGIKGLGALTGSSQIDGTINKLDGKWIVVDHSLLDSLTANMPAKTANATPTSDQVLDEVTAFGRVNQQYVFTTNKSKSVTVVLKKYGVETVDGHKTFHYKMGFNKANLKQYITAQRDALNGSKLDAWIKANNYQSQVNNAYNDLEKSADNVKPSDTFDLWADMSSHLVYKIRVTDSSNPAANYVDLGLNYKNGSSSYPFFISTQSKDSSGTSTGSAIATLDTKANTLALKFNLTSSGTSFSANVTFKPSNQPVGLTAPAGAESLMQALDDMGLGGLLNSYLQLANTSASTPTTPLNLLQ